jgi:nucleotide-binding universal stress UspA family protein
MRGAVATTDNQATVSALRQRSMSMYQRILVPVDGSTTSSKGLEEAVKLAMLTKARLRLIHVIDELAFAAGFEAYAAYSGDLVPMMKEAGEQLLAQAKARVQASGISVDTKLFETLSARVSEVVADEAKSWRADLIVIGTHGRRGVGRLLLGSDAEQIVRMAPVPVLLVRAPDGAGNTEAAVLTGATAEAASGPAVQTPQQARVATHAG